MVGRDGNMDVETIICWGMRSLYTRLARWVNKMTRDSRDLPFLLYRPVLNDIPVVALARCTHLCSTG
jgi:hypothetical protein